MAPQLQQMVPGRSDCGLASSPVARAMLPVEAKRVCFVQVHRSGLAAGSSTWGSEMQPKPRGAELLGFGVLLVMSTSRHLHANANLSILACAV